jgi:cytochrome P450
MQHLTLRIASTALYGLPAGPTTAGIGDMLRRWLALHEAPLTMLLPYDRPGTTYRRLLRASEQFEALFMELISWKRRNLDSQHDVLAMLLQAHDENGALLSDAELVGQASILLNAGHETTSNALTWTLFLLAQHPHVLQDVRDEVQSVLHNSPPTLAQLAQLPLLERVIKESMRVLPPVCYSFRVSTAPFQMGPYEFGRGTGLFFSQYTTHHDPELYAEPQRFLPQRWETIDPSPYEYLPFGAGPRMCIGATFAMLEIKIVLSMIVQRFTLAVQPNARIDQQIKITLSPRHGMPVQVMPLDCVPAAARVRGNVREMVALP